MIWGDRSTSEQAHPTLGTVEGPFMGRREAAVGAHEAAPTGRGDGPLNGRETHRVLVGQDVREEPREQPTPNPIGVTSDALATPAHNSPNDHVAGRLVPVRRNPADDGV